jgi:predicted TIM-barrel fold metal-dependent hydrolase
MLAGFPAIDADAHVYEDPFLLTKRALEELRGKLPQEFGRALGYRFGNQIAHSSRRRWAAFEAGGWEGLRRHIEDAEGGGSQVFSARVTNDLFPGAATMSDGALWEQRYPELPEHYDAKWYSPEYTVAALARQGFDQAFMYPSLGLYLPCFDGMGTLGIECCRIYNDWLLEFCSSAPSVLKPVAMIALHEPTLALEEIQRTHALGFAAACFSRFPDGRTSADPDLEPIWATCERDSILVSFHPVTSNIYLDNQPLERPPSPFEFFNVNMFGQHFANLLLAGVLERHPGLRVALLESGCGWLPSVLWRLERMFFASQKRDDVWGREIPRLLAGMSREKMAENVRMSPVDYFRRQCYIACEAEPFVVEVANLIGEDRLVFQGDFPHPDHHPSYITDFVEMVPERLRRKILWDNPRAMYAETA